MRRTGRPGPATRPPAVRLAAAAQPWRHGAGRRGADALAVDPGPVWRWRQRLPPPGQRVYGTGASGRNRSMNNRVTLW